MVINYVFVSFRAQFVQALVLSTIANLDSFRLAAEDDSEQMAISDSAIVTVDSGDDNVVLGNTAENEAVDQRRNPSNNNNSTAPSSHPCTNMNAVNKKDELEEAEVAAVVGINHNSDSRPPPVKPKPPTATKPVPHNLPNYTSERGAGRGGPSAGGHGGAGGGGIGKGRSQRAEQQQQQQPQPQSNQGASSGQGAGGGAEAR